MIAVESSGKFNSNGGSGEKGRLQYMPDTWIAISKEIEGEVLPHTPINEKYVSVMKVQQLLDKGHNVKEIAMIWNGSLGGVEKPIAKKGTNKWGQKYDTVAHAQKVLVAYNNN
jgi:hypothetical protein